jgi:predicted choloylglycine hydrolase
VGPGRAPRFVDVAGTTNHQGEVEWPEYAEAIRSEEREQCVLALLEEADRAAFEDAFLEPPLHSAEHEQGFGTIYTAAYEPASGRVRYRWPDLVWEQSFERFQPGSRTVTLS